MMKATRTTVPTSTEVVGGSYPEEMEEVEVDLSFVDLSFATHSEVHQEVHRPRSSFFQTWRATLLPGKTCFVKLPVSSCPSL